jgi:DNA-binding response OmpR family regulator
MITSSYRDEARIVASVQSGCDDYIGKPFNLDMVRNKLDKLGIKENSHSIAANETSAPAQYLQLEPERTEETKEEVAGRMVEVQGLF